MICPLSIFTVAAGLVLAGCNSNTAPGNDKEAQLDAPAKAVAQADAATALAGIATGAIQPETMTLADIASIGGSNGRCQFRMTEVGYPSLVYGGARNAATVRLNAKLITLPSSGEGKYADGGLSVAVRPVDAAAKPGERHEAEMVIMLPGAKDELGYRGFSTCKAAATTQS